MKGILRARPEGDAPPSKETFDRYGKQPRRLTVLT
jgi:hypothetical protein